LLDVAFGKAVSRVKPSPLWGRVGAGSFCTCFIPISGISSPNHKGGIRMIRHTVVFTLKHANGSAEERKFIEDALVLTEIPGVNKFERLRQVSPKNNFSFGFSMEFADQAAYDTYNNHPLHVAFVRDRWLVEVSDFLETDYVAM
jgi:hypothetical protein